MRLRTQLMLAAFVLAIIPLAAIVVYSYNSSRIALRPAYWRQAERLTKRMDARLGSIRSELDEGLAGVSALPVDKVQNATSAPHPPVSEIVVAMGDAAPLVDAVAFEPARPAPPAPASLPTAAPEKIDVAVAPAPAAQHEVRVETTFAEPIVVQMPAIPRFVIDPRTAAKMAELRTASRQLAESGTTMTPEEREATRTRVRELSEAVRTEVGERLHRDARCVRSRRGARRSGCHRRSRRGRACVARRPAAKRRHDVRRGASGLTAARYATKRATTR